MRSGLVYILSCAFAAAQLPPSPLESTDVQRKVYASDTAAAASMSADAVPQVEAMLASVVTGNSLSANETLVRLQEEIRVIEVMTNFFAENPAYNHPAADFTSAEANSYWPSDWQVLAASSPSPMSNDYKWAQEAAAEVDIYGFPPFSSGSWYPSSFWDASNRSFYAGLNLLRRDSGFETYGSIAMVWKNLPLVIAPVDTGFYTTSCIYYQTEMCPTWGDLRMGTSEHFVHLIPVTVDFYSAETWLDTMVHRLVLDAEWGATPISDTVPEYWEAMPTKSAYFDDSLRFVIAGFGHLFGDDNYGARLRTWCVQQGKLLVWARGVKLPLNEYTSRGMRGTEDVLAAPSAASPVHPYNARWLDPMVLSLLPANATTLRHPSSQDLELTRAVWRRASRKRPYESNAQWLLLYAELADVLLPAYRVQPLRANDCKHIAANASSLVDACIGTTLDGHTCVCYQ